MKDARFNNINIVECDANGQEKIRSLWRHYNQNGEDAFAVIFMVDSADPDRFEQARDELDKMLADDMLQNAALFILANTQDLPT
eukprot:2030176-Rhodomonas_salina.2